MLLLKKKKYAAIKVINYTDGKETLETEKKGIDMVRRDWCILSKEVGDDILKFILSGDMVEDVVVKINELLTKLGEDMRNNKIPLDKYIITKGLNKSPDSYPDAKGQPHLKVAKDMMKQGKTVNVGDHIPYIICKGTESSPADRAYHPHDIERSNGKLEVDINFYLEHQILPPISRLCDPIEGTSQMNIAEHLGLDGSKYAHIQSENYDFTSVAECKINNSDRFRNCKRFVIECPFCNNIIDFENIKNNYEENGYKCNNDDCKEIIPNNVIYNLISEFISNEIRLYYEGWLKCDDYSCGHRTRFQSVIGERCLQQGCVGHLEVEMSDKMLYNELLYLETLFDRKSNDPKDYDILLLIRNYLNKSAYNYIDPNIFI